MEFALTGGLIALLFAGVLELGLVLHVRNTLIDCAGEGARHGALFGADPAAGAQRTRALVTDAVGADWAQDVTGHLAASGGLDVVEITVTAPVPVLGIGTVGRLDVTGRALLETPPEGGRTGP